MILFGVACFTAVVAVAAVANDPTPGQIDALFSHLNRSNAPGCAVAVERDGRLLYARGFGMANLEYGVPNSPSTVFHVASLSKQFTAFAIQLLAEDGKLKLDDDIHKFIPEMHDFGEPITVGELLHHTSGLRDQWNLVTLAGWRMDDVITQEDLLGLLFRQTALNFEPGSKYSYCNSGYTLLALIVERVSGKSLRDFCEQRVFMPLAMAHTHFHDDYGEIVPNRAVSYGPRDNGGFELEVLSYSNVGATSLFSTVEDFARWAHNFDDPKVGGAEVMERLLATEPLTGGGKNDYACGLMTGSYRGLPTLEHSGADAGFRSDFLRFPAQHLSICILANSADATPDRLARQVANLFLSAEMSPSTSPPPDPAVTVDAKTLAGYAGCFAFDPGTVGVFDVKDGKLRVTYGNQDPIELHAVSSTEFRSPGGTTYQFATSGECKRVNGEGAEAGMRLPDVTPSPNYFGDFVGDYYSEELRQVYRVEKTNQGLHLVFLKHGDGLQPIARDNFGFEGWVVRFERDPRGQVVRMLLSSGRSYNIEFDRVTIKKA